MHSSIMDSQNILFTIISKYPIISVPHQLILLIWFSLIKTFLIAEYPHHSLLHKEPSNKPYVLSIISIVLPSLKHQVEFLNDMVPSMVLYLPFSDYEFKTAISYVYVPLSFIVSVLTHILVLP